MNTRSWIWLLILAGGALAAPACAQEEPGIEEKWGIEVQRIKLTAAGHMLDFRFRVIDPEKARPLFTRQTKPYLIDRASGAKLVVPRPAKTGPLRSSNEPMADRVYWMFFANPGKTVKAGGEVTVVIGDFQAEGLTVE